MRRSLPSNPLDRTEYPAPQRAVTLSLKLATPMIGGGAVAGKPDEHYPIRASEIRGQLRFWWRALHGCLRDDLAGMRQDESAIFGSTEVAGKLALAVLPTQQASNAQRLDLNRRVPNYVKKLMTQDQLHPETFPWTLSNCSFDLTVEGESLSSAEWGEVEDALRAWIAFGGVGARCRRGAGTVCEADHPPAMGVTPQGLGDLLRIPHGATPLRLPRLRGAKVFLGPAKNSADQAADQAWAEAVKLFQAFRKGALPGEERPHHGIGSHTSWPEAAQLRGHAAGPIQVPRARLGLPLKFAGQGLNGHVGIPVVRANGSEPRYGSPVIVKAALVGGAWRPLILILRAPSPSAADLQIDGEAIDLGYGSNRQVMYQENFNVTWTNRPQGDTLIALEHYLRKFASIWEEVS